jgi:hypothetical protein
MPRRTPFERTDSHLATYANCGLTAGAESRPEAVSLICLGKMAHENFRLDTKLGYNSKVQLFVGKVSRNLRQAGA